MFKPPSGPNGGSKCNTTPLSNIPASPPSGHALQSTRTLLVSKTLIHQYSEKNQWLPKANRQFLAIHVNPPIVTGKLFHNRYKYFSERKYVEDFIVNYGRLNVDRDRQYFSARLFTTPAQRIVISNVSAIPFVAIENVLKVNEMQMISLLNSNIDVKRTLLQKKINIYQIH